VVLTKDAPDQALQAGDSGTVVLVHQEGKRYEVEFATVAGKTLAVVTVPADMVRPIRERVIAPVREMGKGEPVGGAI